MTGWLAQLGVVSAILLAGPAVAQPDVTGPLTGQPSDEAEQAEPIPALVAALYGDDHRNAQAARTTLLCMDLSQIDLVGLARAATTPEHLAAAQDIARHHVLTRLREQELADLEDESVIIGFQFMPKTTAGQIGPGTGEIVEQFPNGAQVTTTTPGFPGYAYLQPQDMIVRIDGDPFPQDAAAAQQFLIVTVKAHSLDQTIRMTVVRNSALVELTIPFAPAAALPAMYDGRTVTRDLIDPFLFLWEEAWSTILLEAGYDEDAPPADGQDLRRAP